MSRILIALFAAIMALSSPSVARAAAVRQVYLLQNSGWMEPYYLDPRSQFMDLARILIEATQLVGVDITVATFNQDGQVPGERSPRVLYEGAYSPEAVARQLARVTLPRRPNGRYADADFLGALQGTIADLLHQGEGIIWMLSNNKNSPNNSQDVDGNTRGFYDLLRSSPFVTRIVAFPLRMQVSGPNFSENGFIVYGIAYGEAAARALDVITGQDTPLRGVFTDPPIFLKPTDPQVLELRIERQEVAGGGDIEMRQGIVVVDGLDASRDNALSFVGTVANIAYPKKIVSARLAVSWAGQGDGPASAGVQAEPPVIENVAAGAYSVPLRFTLAVPPQPRPPGLAGLLATETVIDGTLSIALSDLSFDLDDAFIAKASAVFGGAMMGEGQRSFVEKQLPAIFFGFRDVHEQVTTIPIRMVLRYPAWPLYAALAGGGLAAALAAGVPFTLLRPRTYVVNVGGEPQRIRLRPSQQLEVSNSAGQRALARGRLFGPPSLNEPS